MRTKLSSAVRPKHDLRVKSVIDAINEKLPSRYQKLSLEIASSR